MVDVLRQPHEMPGRVAVGSVHHVAWRTPDDEQQLAWQHEINRAGLDVTQVYGPPVLSFDLLSGAGGRAV